ncbi:glycosyltransferase [bacterium]|nr:glycosyltransferase [bacterium]
MRKLVITGGHLTPALAVIDEIRARWARVEILFVGREYAQLTTGQRSQDARACQARGIRFIDFAAPKTGSFNPLTYGATLKAAAEILRSEHADAVASFGGYMGLPFVLAAKKLNIFSLTHEQTRVLGRANRVMALAAGKLALSYPDTKKPWYIKKFVVTGNPVRAGIFQIEAPAPGWYSAGSDWPVLYVAGGSQGSSQINQAVVPIVSQLTRDYVVVHQVGPASQSRDPRAEIERYLAENNIDHTRYIVRDFLSETELAFLYPRIRLAVSRAGANTVSELTAFRIPTLYIPLPAANYHEQEINARSLVEQGAALMLTGQFHPSDLLSYIRQLEQQRSSLSAALQKIPQDREAAGKIVQLLQEGTRATDQVMMSNLRRISL